MTRKKVVYTPAPRGREGKKCSNKLLVEVYDKDIIPELDNCRDCKGFGNRASECPNYSPSNLLTREDIQAFSYVGELETMPSQVSLDSLGNYDIVDDGTVSRPFSQDNLEVERSGLEQSSCSFSSIDEDIDNQKVAPEAITSYALRRSLGTNL